MASEAIQVFCLDVGQGDATVIVGPRPGTAIIVDAWRAEPVLDVLRNHSVVRVPIALLTHDDEDHLAGFANVLSEFLEGMGGCVGIVAFDQDRFEATEPFARLLARLRMLCIPEGPAGHRAFRLCSPTTNDHYLVAALRGTRFARLLYPSKTEVDLLARLGARPGPRGRRRKPRSRPNEASAVLMLEWAGQRMLLGADLGGLGWTVLSKNSKKGSLRADVFRFPHHGGRFTRTEEDGFTLSQAELLELVDPSAVIVSVGTNNGHGHPDPGTLRAICSRKDTRLLCTQATALCLGGQSGQHAPDEQPTRCARTVIVTLGTGSSPRIAPSRSKHRRVIDTFASPACREHL